MGKRERLAEELGGNLSKDAYRDIFAEEIQFAERSPVPEDYVADNPAWDAEQVAGRGLRLLEARHRLGKALSDKERRRAEKVLDEEAEYAMVYGDGHRGYLNACFLALAGCRLSHLKNSPQWRLAGQIKILSVFLYQRSSMEQTELGVFLSLVGEITDEIKRRRLAVVPELAALSERLRGSGVPEGLTYSIDVTSRISMPDFIDEIRNISDREVRSLGFDKILRVAVTDEEFLAGLNLELPGLEKVKQCVAKGDIPAAREAYIDYVTSGKDWEFIRKFYEDELRKADIAEADEICRNVLTLRAHTHIKHDFGEDVNWSACLLDDFETNVGMNHHQALQTLAGAYFRTGEEKYAEHLARHFLSWRRQSPAPHYIRRVLQWRLLEVGSRPTFAWPKILSTLSTSESFKKEVLFAVCKSYLEAGRFLVATLTGRYGNHMQVETCGLAVCGLLFPEFIESQRFCEVAFRRLSWSSKANFFPDGFQRECSTHYHLFPVAAMANVFVAAKAMKARMPKVVAECLRKAGDVLIYMCKPDFTLPHLGDCEPAEFSFHIGWAGRLSNLFNEPTLEYIGSRGSRGKAPPETSFAFPHAGYYVMRDKWTEDGQYLVFDAGCFGSGHQHDDKLSFELHAYGRTLIIDPGIYQYRLDEFEPYFRGTIGHNSVLIDGKGQHRRLTLPRTGQKRIVEPTPDPDTRWIRSESFDYCEGWYRNGYARRTLPPFNEMPGMRESDLATLERNLQHRRRFFYVKGEYYILHDEVHGSGDKCRRLERVFHLGPIVERWEKGAIKAGKYRIISGNGIVTDDPGQANIAILPLEAENCQLQVYCSQTKPVVRGFVALYGKVPCHDISYSISKKLPAA
ncbi:MAG: alginate lyase family protein, partial [Phycisphaerae bacterium]|nr:alginate lyase family protein [Phycisphaerae bacterium]